MSAQLQPAEVGWPNLFPDFVLEQVRVVATLGHDGGAIVENLRKLQCSESRLYSCEFIDGAELHTFEYVFGFHESDDADPLASTSAPGRIVITGIVGPGHRLEIRGDGWIGYDNTGKLEGRFDSPPAIITDDWESASGADECEESDPAFVPIADFPLPPQYVQATVRFPPVGDD